MLSQRLPMKIYFIMPSYIKNLNAIEQTNLVGLRESVLNHNFVSSSTLRGAFDRTSGFSITVTNQGIGELLQRFPFLDIFCKTIEMNRSLRQLQPWYNRFRSLPIPNVFYINLLLIPVGVEVGQHVDATLRPLVEIANLTPQRVSVLWLTVPQDMSGGLLRLYDGSRKIADITPKEGMLVHFRGDLGHEVTTVCSQQSNALRASLVCEQYFIPPEQMERLSPFRINSTAGFGAYFTEENKRT